jgi:hypothetical protein
LVSFAFLNAKPVARYLFACTGHAKRGHPQAVIPGRASSREPGIQNGGAGIRKSLESGFAAYAAPRNDDSRQMIEMAGHGIALDLVARSPALYEPVGRLHDVALIIENN